MSVEQIEACLAAMPVSERLEFARWFDAHRHELLPKTDDVSPEVRTELELRLKEMDAHPELLEPFEEEDLERMIQNTVNAHAKKSSPRQR